MRGFVKRFLRRHANALAFWAVVILVAFALVMAVAWVRHRLG